MRLLVMFLAAASAVFGADLAGDWQGGLNAGTEVRRLVLHITRDTAGNYTGDMDSVDRGIHGILVSGMSLQGAKFTFTIEVLRATYTGTVSSDGGAIKGTWAQNDQSVTLEFKRAPARKEQQ